MANSESTVALPRSKHRICSKTSCVFKIKMDFTIDRGSFCYCKSHLQVCNDYKRKFIDRIHTKELENGKNMLLMFLNVISAAVSVLMF